MNNNFLFDVVLTEHPLNLIYIYIYIYIIFFIFCNMMTTYSHYFSNNKYAQTIYKHYKKQNNKVTDTAHAQNVVSFLHTNVYHMIQIQTN